jgi:acyl-CoA thioesterase I
MWRRTSLAGFLACLTACSALVLLEETAHAQAHVTCVGDSITAGNGTSAPAAAYPAVLQTLLGASFAVENDGRSGATLMSSGDRPYTSTVEYSRSTAWAVAGGDVVIELGTNDSKPGNWSKKAAFLADCKALVTHYLAAAGKPRVWVSLVPPATADACCSIDGAVIANEIVPLLRTCAAETGVATIDVFGALQPHPQYFVDGVHPNDTGAALIAQTVRDAIVRLPTITLSAMPTTSSGSSPSAVTLTAAATAAYGKVEKVVFYEGTVVLEERTAPPWAVTLAALAAGSHVYHAEVIETAGRTIRSANVTAVVAATPNGVTVITNNGPGTTDPAGAAQGGNIDVDGGRPTEMDAASDASGDVPNGCACRSVQAETGGAEMVVFTVLVVVLSALAKRRRKRPRD